MTQIWTDLEVSNPNRLSQKVYLAEESWRRILDLDKSCRLRKIRKTDTLIPSRVTIFVSWNISPPMDSKVFHWSEWFRSRTNRGQRFKTLLRCRRYLECNASIVTLCTCNKLRHANISKPPEYNLLIMLVTKESNNIHVKSYNNNICGTEINLH